MGDGVGDRRTGAVDDVSEPPTAKHGLTVFTSHPGDHQIAPQRVHVLVACAEGQQPDLVLERVAGSARLDRAGGS